MKILGIIAEYNPFHNGHLRHLKMAKKITETDVTVAVMSGDFVQRGEPAIFDKWVRSEMAVRNGVDLVLELPFTYACNNAELFARGGTRLLDSLGCIDSICFGSEEGDLEPLAELAGILEKESTEFSVMIREKMNEGISYPKARQEVLSHFTGEEKASIMERSNNILGVEYLKELKTIKSKIKPFTVKRVGVSETSVDREMKIAGATAMRRMLDDGSVDEFLEYLPEESRNMVQGCEENASYEMFRDIIIYSIISKNTYELSNIYSVSEGLENKILSSAKESRSVKQLIGAIKSKRYTETRIKRILIHILLGLTREKMNKILNEDQLYARVLAFNDKGASILKKIKNDDRSRIPVITNISKEKDMLKPCPDIFNYDILASDIYNQIVKGDIYHNSDYRKIPANVNMS